MCGPVGSAKSPLDYGDELAKHFEDSEPKAGVERVLEEYVLERHLAWADCLSFEERRVVTGLNLGLGSPASALR